MMYCSYAYLMSSINISTAAKQPGPDSLSAGPLFRKNVGPLLYEYPPPPDCLHPTRTVVIIDILLRTRAAMHTTIAAAAVWQFEASL